ncbi:mannitol dehydrogenase family protein [Pararhizobium mangrovi]|uniref:Mannitol dehydrogenase family protein n=1 Tax=Pararhizobium mangrovi TaxID=2590452 RepID=A0A506U5B7_9HYPH|nr:mannitol dehydrogenase family protein [Pararhizobium mangrovi]TPW28155.1 mannitol dehydrogenase family protein [Pararhizobium mangrovi]
MSTKLSLANLPQIAETVAVPQYARDDLSAGIVHFGVGNFHRAHQAVYLDDLFNTGADHDWALIGAGVLPSDEAMRKRLEGQDWLSTVVEQDNNRSDARVTGSMIGMMTPNDKPAIVEKLADPTIRIVSLTITEGGYYVNPSTGVFDPTYDAIAADGANPDEPQTVFGLIVAGLKARRDAGTRPFTVMSCDNIPGNGEVARDAVAGLAELSDAELGTWIRENVAFPNAMVDRITPATGDREISIAREDFGIDDAFPVFCEEFRQWVLEDHFPAGRPAFEKAGVTIVEDVAPYERMKIRILNGGHAVIAYPAGLMDIHFVHEAMENELVARFLEKIETEEIIPMVPPVPDTDLRDYFGTIKHRFANPKIGDTVRRLCLDGSNRQPKFILPSTAARLKEGLSVTGLALESALWCRYCYGESESGAEIAPNDPNWERLQAHARRARNEPLAFLEMTDIFGEVGESEAFRTAFEHALSTLWEVGTAETLKRYLSDSL